MDRLRPADGSRRLGACAGAGRRNPRPARRGGAAPSSRSAPRSASSIPRRAEPWLPDFRSFASSVLGWSFSPKGYAGTDESPIPPELEVALPDYGETLRPDFAVRELEPEDDADSLAAPRAGPRARPGLRPRRCKQGRLEASPHGRMERLLRETGVPAGLLFNGRALRLDLGAARRELRLDGLPRRRHGPDRRPADLHRAAPAARPVAPPRLPRPQRLAALLEDSRKYQNEVSERLAEQVLHALYELLRGFQAAHDASKGELLREPLAEHPDEVYRALLTVLLRLVFLLYAEERDMLPEDETFLQPLLACRAVRAAARGRRALPRHDGPALRRLGAAARPVSADPRRRRSRRDAAPAAPRLPLRPRPLQLPRRPAGDGARQIHERIEPPLVPDGTIYRVLEKLLVLDGERITYRALDVEQIGSVYETMMGFRLETATGRSVAVKAAEEARRTQRRSTSRPCSLSPRQAGEVAQGPSRPQAHRPRSTKAVKEAASLEDLQAALRPRDRPSGHARPGAQGRDGAPAERGAAPLGLALHAALAHRADRAHDPGANPRATARRGTADRPDPSRSSTSRSATRRWARARSWSRPAASSATRWSRRGTLTTKCLTIPPDEDEVIFARRLVAQRCLYGVDRNPMAVDLAKVSLWLATLAKDHPLTFLDHALRHGDSLVGLSREQIEGFHWDTSGSW